MTKHLVASDDAFAASTRSSEIWAHFGLRGSAAVQDLLTAGDFTPVIPFIVDIAAGQQTNLSRVCATDSF
jgi:hypothetical protein